MSLNPAQRAAVRYTAGPLLVLAGAGSGKTRVITEKIAHLIDELGMPAAKIAAITFTNKAAREMRERAGKLLSSAAADALTVSTFHALGLKFLQIEHAAAGLKRGFSVFDIDDAQAILKDLVPKTTKPDELKTLHALISRAKNEGFTPMQAQERSSNPRELEASELYADYQRRLETFNAVDFDDLIRLPLRVLEASSDIRDAWRERIRYLLVDEYQDTNIAQYRLLSMLTGEHGRFTAVGDDDQSIYGWRGANPGNLNQLISDYPTLKVLKLEQNYRCAARILRVANNVIANNPHQHPKKLWSESGEGALVRVLEARDDEHEAERIAGEILHLAGKYKARWNEFAILYRGNFQSRPLEKALRLARVPYHITGGTAFLERAEVKDLLAYLRLILNPDDDAAFLRIVNLPRRDIGATTLEKLAALAQVRQMSLLRTAASDAVLKQLPAKPAAGLAEFCKLIWDLSDLKRKLTAADLCAELIRRTRYAEYLAEQIKDQAARARRLENLNELAEWFRAMQQQGTSTGDLAAQLALLTHMDHNEPGNAVRLMTLHSAKGLEFRFVNIVGLEDGTLPHEGSLMEGRLEEERRLLYVGITRAKEQLMLSYAARKRRFGEIVRNTPSRFLKELPPDDLHWVGRDAEQDQAHTRELAASHIARLASLLTD